MTRSVAQSLSCVFGRTERSDSLSDSLTNFLTVGKSWPVFGPL